MNYSGIWDDSGIMTVEFEMMTEEYGMRVEILVEGRWGIWSILLKSKDQSLSRSMDYIPHLPETSMDFLISGVFQILNATITVVA